MTLGNTISENRKRLGLTQEALAKILGVTNQAVSKWETDQSCPDVMLLPGLADALGITLDILFGREPKSLELIHEAPEDKAELPWQDDDAFHVVLYCGHKLIGENPIKEKVCFCYEGPVKDLYSDFSVECESVEGSVNAGTYVECGDVSGNVNAGTYVECSDVGGDVISQGYVECGDVGGSVAAGGNVSGGDVGHGVMSGFPVEQKEQVTTSVPAGINEHAGNADQLLNGFIENIRNLFRKNEEK